MSDVTSETDIAMRTDIAALVVDCQRAEAEVERLRERIDSVIAWCQEQHDYCRPPHLADAPDEEVDRRRGPCAAYGAVVYDLVIRRLSDITALPEDR